MNFSSLLDPGAVRVTSHSSSKKRLLQEISDLCSKAYGVCSSMAVDALLERESLGPTGVGHGVALPHARLTDIDRVVGVFLRLEKPMDFGAADRQPVDLVFGLFAPANDGVEHLKALALVSRTLRNPATCAKLRSNTNPAALHAILTAEESTQAA
jgi:PTS system nitrogen regulatory IIA component